MQELEITAALGQAEQGGIIPLPEQISPELHGAAEQTLGAGGWPRTLQLSSHALWPFPPQVPEMHRGVLGLPCQAVALLRGFVFFFSFLFLNLSSSCSSVHGGF